MPVRDNYVHEYDQTHFRLERPALHLVSLLVADKELKRTYRTGVFPHLQQFAEEEKESEVIRLTIEIATTYRLMFWNAKQKPKHDVVGELCVDDTTKNWTELTMLEACHKVIHAEYFAFETRRFPGSDAHFLKPKLHLAGTKGKQGWLAVVEALPFANAAIQPIDSPF